MTASSPLIFEDRSDGRVDAMLGAITVGSIFPIDHPRARAGYLFALPPKPPMRFVRDLETAKLALVRCAREWLQAAGLREA